MKRKYVRALCTLIVLLLCLTGILFWAHRRAEKQTAQYESALIKVSNLQKLIDQKQNEANRKAEKAELNSGNPRVRLGAQQQLAVKKAKMDVSELFDILLTYSSAKEYEERKEASEPFLAKKLLSSTNLFRSDKLKGGDSFIDITGLHSQYLSDTTSVGVIDKDGTVPVTIIVKYKSWFTGERRGTGKDIYVGRFDYKEEQFTELQRLNSLTE